MRLGASFRDPSGFLFTRDGTLYRQVDRSGEAAYRRLMESGLYQALVDRTLLIPHREVDVPPAEPGAALLLAPERVAFVSHPYEWCFSELQEAALATLAAQRLALAHGMWLKDASAFNVQFHDGRPLLIDTLSFDLYPEGRPWVAYRQFCQHFLAPLALMACRDLRLGRLSAAHLDGVPLDLACALLPHSARLRPGLLLHLYLHAASQRRHAGRGAAPSTYRMSRRALEGLCESLERAIRRPRWRGQASMWSEYYGDTNYSAAAFAHKRELVGDFLSRVRPASLWDLGANTGLFSRQAAAAGIPTLAFDADPVAVELAFRECRRLGERRVLPLCLDLTNPSPALGWAHAERASLVERGPAGAVLALALVHHLAIGNNVPLQSVAALIARLTGAAIVEWVPKEDSQVKRLLASREDVFREYARGPFEAAFTAHFALAAQAPIRDSCRILYLFQRAEAR
ncbi:MAG: SAM-dependent methyltransferase [Thermoanaerobaculia bacterium]